MFHWQFCPQLPKFVNNPLLITYVKICQKINLYDKTADVIPHILHFLHYHFIFRHSIKLVGIISHPPQYPLLCTKYHLWGLYHTNTRRVYRSGVRGIGAVFTAHRSATSHTAVCGVMCTKGPKHYQQDFTDRSRSAQVASINPLFRPSAEGP